MNIFEFIFVIFFLIYIMCVIIGFILLPFLQSLVLIVLFYFSLIFGMLFYFAIKHTIEKITESNWFNKIKRIFK